MKLSQKAQQLKPSPTLAIAAQAKLLQSQGEDVISLSVGEPDWDTFQSIKAEGIRAIENGQTKYAPAAGIPALRQSVAKLVSKETGIAFKPEEVTVSVGAKFILFAALQMLLDPGDEVLIPTPYWVSYPTMVELAGGKPIIVESKEVQKFHVHPEDFKGLVTEKTKVLILNSPSNPSGEVLSKVELLRMAEFLRLHPNIVVLSDDIYNRLIFNGTDEGFGPVAPHLLQVAPDLRDRVLCVNGASKSFSMTGWRLGWAVGPTPLIKAMSDYQSQSASCASPFTQLAGVHAIEKCLPEVQSSIGPLKERRDLFVVELNKIPGLKVSTPDGAFYLWVDVRDWLKKSFKGSPIGDTRNLAMILLQDQKLAVVPGAESGIEGFLRLSFALDMNSIRKACERFKLFQSRLA